jgi:L-ribulose-5-phosphate 3-epimerase
MEIGLVFWAEQRSQNTLRQLQAFGLSSGQIGVPSELSCDAALDDWATALDEAQLRLSTAVCSYQGEDYSNLQTIHQTVGFTTESLRSDRIARTKEVSSFAHALDIPAVSCHIGFIPANKTEPLYKDLRDLTRLLCDACAAHNQNFVLETGQESAAVLLTFIHDVDRQNLKVNFDPANMIMYQSGDPLTALDILSPHIISVHCKDAHSPAAGSGLLGEECVLGDGEVNFPAFLQKLKSIGYQGLLSIEREEPNTDRRTADIYTGISRLNQWNAEMNASKT